MAFPSRLLRFGLIALTAGCVNPPKNLLDIGKAAAPPAKQVKTGGACLDLGEGHQAAYTADQFVAKVGELLAAGRFASTRHYIGLYPDLCQDALRRATNADANSPALQAIAKCHDAQTGLAGTPLSWETQAQERKAKAPRFASYDVARKQALEASADKAAALLALVKAATQPLLELDAHRLAGDEFLRLDKADNAASEFAAALKLLQGQYPYQAVQLHLLLGEAYRRAGKIEQGVGAWQQAVVLAGQEVRTSAALADPILWETAAALRPVNAAWPVPVLDVMVPGKAPRHTQGTDEAWLWTHIGQWRMERGEPQAALLAFKRAESMTVELHAQEDLHLLQASALAQVGQGAAAAALLAPLVDKPRPQVSAAALAVLGSLKLQTGAGPQATTLLKKALDVATSGDWPGRAEAEADLGLACLLTGDADTGMRSLHAAQQRFEASGNLFMLRQCLENEIAYLKRIGQPEAAERVRASIDARELH